MIYIFYNGKSLTFLILMKYICSLWNSMNSYIHEYIYIYIIFYNFIIYLIISDLFKWSDHSNNILFIYNYLKLHEILL